MDAPSADDRPPDKADWTRRYIIGGAHLRPVAESHVIPVIRGKNGPEVTVDFVSDIDEIPDFAIFHTLGAAVRALWHGAPPAPRYFYFDRDRTLRTVRLPEEHAELLQGVETASSRAQALADEADRLHKAGEARLASLCLHESNLWVTMAQVAMLQWEMPNDEWRNSFDWDGQPYDLGDCFVAPDLRAHAGQWIELEPREPVDESH